MANSISFATLLEQNQPQIEGHQALIIFGLQQDFLASDGKLPVPLDSGWLHNIQRLVPRFRDFVGDVIWVRHEFQSERVGSAEEEKIIVDVTTSDAVLTNDDLVDPEDASRSPARKSKKGQKRMKAKQFFRDIGKKEQSEMAQLAVQPEDDELFLTHCSKGPCCLPGSSGAAMAREVMNLIQDDDVVLVASHYSAFSGTGLLTMLRMRLVTELFVVGCMTNLSVHATAQDAASHGLAINLVEDCLGYRIRRRHDAAIENLVTVMGAYKTTSAQMLEEFVKAERDEDEAESREEQKAAAGLNGLTAALGHLDLDDFRSAPADDLTTALGYLAMNDSNRASMDSDDMDVTTLAESLAAASLRASLDVPIARPATADLTSGALSSQIPQSSQPSMSSSDVSLAANIRVRVSRRNDKESTPAKSDPPQEPAEAPRPDLHANVVAQILETKKPLEDSQPCQKVFSTLAARHPASTASAGGRHEDLAEEIARMNANIQTPMTENNLESSTALLKDAPAKPAPMKYLSNATGHTAHCTHKYSKASGSITARKFRDLSTMAALGPGDHVGEGETFITYDLIPGKASDGLDPTIPTSESIFDALRQEVHYQKMFHAAGEVPRLVAVQGAVAADGSKPVYRHPSDQSPPLQPFTRHVDFVRQAAEKVVGHRLNHVLIQLYRDGTDYISEHSDKTLDIVKGSKIVNASFGAQRTMRLRTKRNDARNEISPQPARGWAREREGKVNGDVGEDVNQSTQRITQRIHMPHNSLFVLGLATNRYWLHGITQDKRADRDRSPEELAYDGSRISLTFRHIGTFIDRDETLIWGQGARGKTRGEAGGCVNADEATTQRMIDAFGFENQGGDTFDWEEVYGEGFDVLNMRAVNGGADP